MERNLNEKHHYSQPDQKDLGNSTDPNWKRSVKKREDQGKGDQRLTAATPPPRITYLKCFSAMISVRGEELAVDRGCRLIGFNL